MNILELMRQAKQTKQIIKEVRATGKAGGDMVVITLNGEYKVEDIQISEEILAKNNTQLLQDLIKSAFYDASNKLKKELQAKVGGMLQGQDILSGLMGGNQ